MNVFNRLTTFIFLLFVLLLSACGGGDDDSPVSISSASDTNTVTASATEAPSAENPPRETIASALEGRQQGLLIVQGQSLLFYDFESGSSRPVADEMIVDSLKFLPASDIAIYSLPDTRSIIYENLGTGTRQELVPDIDQNLFYRWSFRSESPDHEWLILQSGRWVMIVSADGQSIHTLEQPYSVTFEWLVDNNVLMVGSGNNNPVYEAYRLGEESQTELDIAPEALAADPGLMDSQLAALDLQRRENPNDFDRIWVEYPQEIIVSSGGYCNDWRISHQQVRGGEYRATPLYEAEGVFGLSDPFLRPDGSLLFLEARTEDCSPLSPSVALLLWQEDRLYTISDDVFPGAGVGRDTNALMIENGATHRLSVSPDGDFAAWISGNVDEGSSALHLSDLRDPAFRSETLLSVEIGNNSRTVFVDEQMIYEVYWVNRAD